MKRKRRKKSSVIPVDAVELHLVVEMDYLPYVHERDIAKSDFADLAVDSPFSGSQLDKQHRLLQTSVLEHAHVNGMSVRETKHFEFMSLDNAFRMCFRVSPPPMETNQAFLITTFDGDNPPTSMQSSGDAFISLVPQFIAKGHDYAKDNGEAAWNTLTPLSEAELYMVIGGFVKGVKELQFRRMAHDAQLRLFMGPMWNEFLSSDGDGFEQRPLSLH